MATAKIALPVEEVRRVCQQFGVEELAVFGSALTEEFRQDSDVDFLVVFKDDDYGPWMAKLDGLEQALAQLLERNVDVVPRKSLKWVIRDRVLSQAQVLYEDR